MGTATGDIAYGNKRRASKHEKEAPKNIVRSRAMLFLVDGANRIDTFGYLGGGGGRGLDGIRINHNIKVDIQTPRIEKGLRRSAYANTD